MIPTIVQFSVNTALQTMSRMIHFNRPFLTGKETEYIRQAVADGKILGVAHKGDELPYGGQVSDGGWLKVVYQGQDAWVSGKYGKLE